MAVHMKCITHLVFLVCWILFVNISVRCEVMSNVTATKNPVDPVINHTTLEKPVTKLNTTTVAAEGGVITPHEPLKQNDTTHQGREHTVYTNHMFKVPTSSLNKTEKVAVNSTSTTTTTSSSALPAYDMAEKNDNTKSVPKKGVADLPLNITQVSNVSTSTTTTTTKPRKKKPLITEASEDNPVSNKQQADDKTKDSQIPSLEDVTQEKTKHKADYVVPIVVVILSVPLVAIVISVLYKRGSEWWQHRHYRRMDFLIEGMYNN